MASAPVALPGGRVQTVYRAGDGPPLVWLHGLNGVEGDAAIVEALGQRHHVLAPLAPGFNDLEELSEIRDIHDLALHYDDLLDALELPTAILVGHSFGAMIAAELAAHFPKRVDKLVLISPLGLWNDAYPVTDVFAVPSTEMPRLLYRTPPPSANGTTQDVERIVTLVRGMTTVARFLWPIPDRGLARRLYRIQAPTLIVHGEHDAFVPVQYAHDFGHAVHGARVSVFEGEAHMLPTEATHALTTAINTFLGSPL
ncbi:MAG TPA: alpha/beta hydrolase [Chloroflexota bacterium]